MKRNQTIRVLLADPEPQLLFAYRQFLETKGIEVATASDGKVCLSKLSEWQPDVLVLEPETPQQWGEEVLDRLRHPQERRVPVLILSRRDRTAIAYPVHEYYVKPVSLVELVRSIRIAVTDARDGPEADE